MFFRTSFACCLAVAAYGKPMARSMQVHNTRSNIPSSFRHLGPAPPDATLSLRIGLVEGNFSGLEKALMDVSTPGNPLYGQHLSKEEAEAFVAPKPESAAAVHTWLQENGIEINKVSPTGSWLAVSIPVSKASELLDAQFSVYNHTTTGKTFIRTLAYSIPADLKGHLDYVHPTTTFVQPFQSPKFNLVPARTNKTITPAPNLTSNVPIPPLCDFIVTPQCLQSLYGIPTFEPPVEPTNQLGVSGFDNQFANRQDLTLFIENLCPSVSTDTQFNFESIGTGQDPQGPSQAGIEANIDIQYTVGIANMVPVTFFSIGTQISDGASGFLEFIESVLGLTNPPLVLSTSYGFNEGELGEEIAANLCRLYAQAGARGISLIFNTGDGGVSGCVTQQCTLFIPTFPSSCPFVTSVGATAGIEPEVAASFSCGGFSNMFTRQSYQNNVVDAYLEQLGTTNNGLFNPDGRAFPDIAAQGENIEIVLAQQFGIVSGTSCATPIVASMFALLNDLLLAQNRPSLGFLNPLLYSLAGGPAFTDITSGNNPGCRTDGFPATQGWDPVTGLGTLNFPALQSALGL
ncbi:family S53 protease [Trametes meyenii]|nr:family S53 protease [Trametes meyenii]